MRSGSRSQGGVSSELTQRVLVALIAIPVVLAVVYVGGPALAALLAIAAALAAWEFFRLADRAGYHPIGAAGIPLAAIMPLVMHAAYLDLARPRVTWGILAGLGIFVLALWVRGPNGRPIGATAVTVFGVLYTGGLLSYGYILRYDNYAVGSAAGSAMLLFPLVLTWASDSAGYFVGRAVGRHKLLPSVSPGKTVEGAVGALVVSVLVAWAYVHGVLMPLAQLALTPAAIVVAGIVVSAAVQLGDLAESLIKREAGVKDSSHLIPGHGGVLDRLDGMLFALPVAYWLASLPHVFLPAPR